MWYQNILVHPKIIPSDGQYHGSLLLIESPVNTHLLLVFSTQYYFYSQVREHHEIMSLLNELNYMAMNIYYVITGASEAFRYWGREF